ncbi:MAG: acyl-CoA synthetase [Bacillaceae bacterium G1]|nr:acyl-CoA synthetase [Bacillota bacterium]OJF17986.1 MAG: acyl-CoA synthetase [Bacillaceae bacterium G1]
MATSNLASSRQLLIGEALRRAAFRSPEVEAYVYEDVRVTYRQFEAKVLHLAGWLQQEGFGYDDKVGFILRNELAFPEIFFAVALAGTVGVPINFRLTGHEIRYIVNNSDSKILFIGREFVDTIREIRDQLPLVQKIVVVGSDKEVPGMIRYESIFERHTTFTPCEQLTDDDACMIVYTSGTTGHPKGAVLTHKNLYMNSMNAIAFSGWKPYNKQLVVPPLFHVAAMSTLITTTLQDGTSVIHREFDPVKILETIQSERINSLFLVPAMWNFLFQVPTLHQYDLSSLTSCSTGGAVTPLELKKRIMQTFPNAQLYEAFGQTEMSPCTTMLGHEHILRKTDSVGLPAPNVEVRIVDEEMNDVPVGEVGEIVYRGPTVMKEYYKNPEATAEAFKGGWFHSGDLVRQDDEGFIYVVDRKKDMIISGGENIYPKEIEEVLYMHPGILEAAVIGVPDATWGETVKAVVVPKPGHTLTAEEVIEHCTRYLASYKKPRMVQFVDALPRNAAGKVLKRVLREAHQP